MVGANAKKSKSTCQEPGTPVKENLGSLTVEGKLVVPGIADARVDTVRGSVVVTTVDAKLYGIPADGAALFGPESYHLHDYGFFYNNFKQNVTDRVKAYMEKCQRINKKRWADVWSVHFFFVSLPSETITHIIIWT